MTANLTQVGGDHYSSKNIQPWDAMASWMTPEQFGATFGATSSSTSHVTRTRRAWKT